MDHPLIHFMTSFPTAESFIILLSLFIVSAYLYVGLVNIKNVTVVLVFVYFSLPHTLHAFVF